jgi:hypothetical protein
MRHFSNEILTRAITFRDGKRQELPLARRVPGDFIIPLLDLWHHAMVNNIRGTVLR